MISKRKEFLISKRKEQAAERIHFTLLVSQYLSTFKELHPSGREEIKNILRAKTREHLLQFLSAETRCASQKGELLLQNSPHQDHRQPELEGWNILGFRKDSQSVCLSRVTSARAGGEGVGVRILEHLPVPIRIHTEGWQTLCSFKKKNICLSRDLHPNFLNLALEGGRLGLVLPALFLLTDLPREPDLLWQQPKWPEVSKEVKFGF